MSWGRASAAALLVTALGLSYLTRGGEGEARATSGEADGGSVLRGALVAPGIDPSLCIARCRPVTGGGSDLREADLDARGEFAFSSLADGEYRLEIVVRSNPALVVASKVVRPGMVRLVFESDPAFLFGPSERDDSDD